MHPKWSLRLHLAAGVWAVTMPPVCRCLLQSQGLTTLGQRPATVSSTKTVTALPSSGSAQSCE
jgi:hypothetical protein